MKKEDYVLFYDEVINECVIKLTKYLKEKVPIHKEIKITEKQKQKIYLNYQKKRDYIKFNYMSRSSMVALDRHKVAACMMYAILKVKPIKVDRRIQNLPQKVMMANEYLAFYTALNIVELYKLDDFNYTKEYNLIFPKTYHENSNEEYNVFVNNVCKALYFVRIDNIEKFDVLAYSNILFMLERYTDSIIEYGMNKTSDLQ